MNRPQVLLLDEPLGALDLKLRKQMQLELKSIQHDLGLTFVHVTHDQEEAMTMADAIAVMNGGRIEQLGPPNELYERPATAFVAGFLGASNLLPGVGRRARTPCRLESGALVRATRDGRSGPVAAGVRPEKITIGAGGGANEPRRARSRRPRTSASRRRSSSRRPRAPSACSRRTSTPGAVAPRPARQVTFTWSPEATFVVDPRDKRGGGCGMNPRMTSGSCSSARRSAAARSSPSRRSSPPAAAATTTEAKRRTAAAR